jgi:hypothetical protein
MEKLRIKNEPHCLREMSMKNDVTFGFKNKPLYGYRRR